MSEPQVRLASVRRKNALTVRAGTAGGSTYNTHNNILEAVANCGKAVGVTYSIGTTFHGVRNADGNCRLGNTRTAAARNTRSTPTSRS